METEFEAPQEEEVWAESEQHVDPNSIEINIDIIKSMLMNFLSLYEALMMKNCHGCDIIRSEEFVRVHNNFVDIDGLLKLFDLSFDKTVFENFVKKAPNKSPTKFARDKKDKAVHNCLLPVCANQYSSYESVLVHFLKAHCCRFPCFEENKDYAEKLDFNEIPKLSDGSYICTYDEYCKYSTKDRSNFRVHRERHRMAKRFYCFNCKKYFPAREPLIIHFIRVHFSGAPWHLATSDIRYLRKSLRKMATPELVDLDLDQIPDLEEDLTGPETLQNLEISAYISQAINHGTVTRNDDCSGIDNSSDIPIQESEVVQVAVPTGDQEVQPEEAIVIEIIDQKFSDEIEPDNDDASAAAVGATVDPVDGEDDVEEPLVKKLKIRRKNFRCVHDYCSQDFYAKKGLLIHLKSNHDPENPFVCDHDGCFSRFKTPTLLAQHKRRHLCQLQCEHCDYRTHLNAQMEKHIRLHTGQEMPHICPECSKRFTFLGQMSNHRKKEHNIVESLACDSPDCEKIFKTIAGLQKHKREFHMNSAVGAVVRSQQQNVRTRRTAVKEKE